MPITIRDIHVITTAPQGINLIVVKVETSEPGLYGLGCATFAYRCLAVKCVIEKYLKPLMIGRDVEKIEENWALMHQNAYWRNGPIENNAISGIDMALWDIKGKIAHMPLYQLLGGKCRAGVPVYRHADGRDFQEICENVKRFQAAGIKVVRCQCGGYGGIYGNAPDTAPSGSLNGVYLNPKKYIRETIGLFEKLRTEFGDKIELCHDVHERLLPRDAIQFAKSMEPFDLFFLEDAIPLEEDGWMEQMRAQTSIPLAQGELFTHPCEWKRLIAGRLIDFLRIHISQIGGITPAKKAQTFAEQFGVRIAWHGPGDMTPLAHAANVHIDISSPNLGIQEWSGTEPPNAVIQKLSKTQEALLEVFHGMPEYKNGYVYVNDLPGLGIDLDEKAAEKFPCSHGVTEWTQTRLPDGSLQSP